MKAAGRPGRHDGVLDAAARRGLLETARGHARGGRTYAAIEGYLRLLRGHPGTVEGQEAGRALLRIARRYEAEGKRYHALSLYDKVAAWLAAGQEPGGDCFPRRMAAAPEEDGGRAGTGGFRDEIPFVDLTEGAPLGRNFEALGRVHRVRAGRLQRAVESLRALKG